MKIRIDGKNIDVAKETKIFEIICQLGIRPEIIIPIRNDEILTSDDIVYEGDEIYLRKVIAGG